jgi:hypothetical protein
MSISECLQGGGLCAVCFAGGRGVGVGIGGDRRNGVPGPTFVKSVGSTRGGTYSQAVRAPKLSEVCIHIQAKIPAAAMAHSTQPIEFVCDWSCMQTAKDIGST